MNDPKKQKFEPEAATIVASGAPSSGSVKPSPSVPNAPADPAGGLSDPRPEDGVATLAGLESPATVQLGSTRVQRTEVDLAGAPTLIASGAPNGNLLQQGSVFANRYEIIKLLGEGGMGAVYKARDVELGREVALKVIRPDLSNNPEIVQRFKQELILARQVTDRNIIRIFDLGEAGGIKFITMEYIEGQNLHQMLRQQGKLEVGEAVEVMEQVAAGLAAAHREGIIHRDLKPGNIMRDVHGRVVVMDFGLARTISGDGMTRTGAMLGTIEYMSPEQAQGKDLKASSDVFTIGLILYELISGATPFHAESAIASLLMRTQQRAVPLAEVDKKIPGTLSNIVAKCLEKEPANRYQSAIELDADLRAWQGKGEGKKVSATAARRHLNRLRELPWKRSAFTGVLVLVVAAGIAWFVVSRRQSANAGPHAPVSVLVADFSNLTGDPLLDDTLEPMIGEALEGASFVNVFSRGDARKLAGKLPHPTDKLDLQSARLVAVNQNVHAVIGGEVSLQWDEYDISARAVDAITGKVLAKSEVSVAKKDDILPSLPRLVVPIRKALGDTTSAAQQFDEVSGGFKAASLEAVHQESIAMEEQFSGHFQAAFDSFQKAAQLDPNLARALSGMAIMDRNLGKSADSAKYMNLAMQHMGDMTERERYRYRGIYYAATGDYQKCVDELTQLVSRYSADRIGQNDLSVCYEQLHNAPQALEAAKRAVDIVPRGVTQRLNLAFISIFAGEFTQGENEVRNALAMSPSSAQGYLVLAEALLGEGKIDQAAAAYHKLETFGPAATSIAANGIADLAAYEGKYDEAARILTQAAAADVAAKNPEDAARKYVALGNIEELRKNHAAALSDVNKALASSNDTSIEFLAARTYVDLGEFSKAQKLAASLSSALTAESQAYGKIVAGLIALKKKDDNEAIRQMYEANKLLDTWIGLFDLGRAYVDAGAFTQADSEFDQCVKRRGEAIELFMDNVPTYAYFPPVDYYQGRSREGMKSPDFGNFYQTYLNVRGQSTEDSLVADAKHRLKP